MDKYEYESDYEYEYESEENIRRPDEVKRECLINDNMTNNYMTNNYMTNNYDEDELMTVLRQSKLEAEEENLKREMNEIKNQEREKEKEELRLNLRPLIARLSYVDENGYYTNLIENYIELNKKISKRNKKNLIELIKKPIIVNIINKFL